MHLISTTTLQLVEHNDLYLPVNGYAILSHRWYGAGEEVTYQDLQSGRDVLHKKGFQKLKHFCEVALSFGYDWAWSDTCCINKDSATELGTALNSMYRWYAGSGRCITYLADVYPEGRTFEQSEWFRSGWTLQELIAPKSISFYDRNWRFIGTKGQMIEILSRTTTIKKAVLTHDIQPKDCSIAQRMSWAAGRITERLEDRAYSLLGIFGVTLEMVYGERENAFIRLQEKIIQLSADQSIFTWALDHQNDPNGYSGMLAPSPDSFAACSNIFSTGSNRAFSISNIGLAVTLLKDPYSMEIYFAFLDCRLEDSADQQVAILVARLPSDGQWARMTDQHGNSVFSGRPSRHAIQRALRVRQIPTEVPLCFTRTYGIWLRDLDLLRQANCEIRILSRTLSKQKNFVHMSPGTFGAAGIVSVKVRKRTSARSSQIRWIDVGFDDEFRSIVMVSNVKYRTVRARSMNITTNLDEVSLSEFSNAVAWILSSRSGKTFDQALADGPASSAHSTLFRYDWSRKFPMDKLSSGRYGALEFGFSAAGTKRSGHTDLFYRELAYPNILYRFTLSPDPSQASPPQSDQHTLI